MYKITKKTACAILLSVFFIIFAVYNNLIINLIKIIREDVTMKPKPKMHHQEEYELDNIYNDESLRYDVSSNTTIWYS